jgi:PTH1 family peptidyl-tRNA hydrolase
MFLLVGLGNPGKQYSNNRHNVGFKVIDVIVDKFNLAVAKDKFESNVFTGEILGQKIVAIKPNTFMNLSGQAVSSFVKFYKIPLSEVIVIHDDIDLELGKVKVKIGGGAGGHNGLKSIDQAIGKDYLRVRIGVDHPGHKDLVSDFVLSNFERGQEQDTINELIHSIANSFELLLSKQYDSFIAQFKK